MTYQRRAEWLATGYMWFTMLVMAISSHYSENPVVLERFAQDWGFHLTFSLFTHLSFAGALAAPLLMLPIFQKADPFYRRVLYLLCGLAVLGYAIPLAWFIHVQGTNPITGAVFGIVLLSFIVICYALYRPRESV